MIRLNIGCGPYKMEGYINIDKNPIWKPDKVLDVRKGLPVHDNSVDEIYASHFIEHLDKDEIIAFMKMSYDKLKNGAMLNLLFPTGVTYELDHKSFLDLSSFRVFFSGGADDYYYGPKIAFTLLSEERTSDERCNMLRLIMKKRV
jgi:hypothetical protein